MAITFYKFSVIFSEYTFKGRQSFGNSFESGNILDFGNII
jgi:hypothetical protein